MRTRMHDYKKYAAGMLTEIAVIIGIFIAALVIIAALHLLPL